MTAQDRISAPAPSQSSRLPKAEAEAKLASAAKLVSAAKLANAAGPDSKVSVPPPGVAPAATVSVSALVWAIQLWVIASVSSLILSAGLSQALRGAYVGAERWIIRVDHAGALTSQVAAICTTLLLIYIGMLSARAARRLMLGVGAALLGTAPTLIVFYAHRFTLPQLHTWISALCGSCALILCATQARRKSILRALVFVIGLSLFSAALRSGGLDGKGTPLLSQVGQMLQGFFAWCGLILAAFFHLGSRRTKPMRSALLLGAALLLGSTVSAATEPAVPDWILLTGRSLGEISTPAVLGKGAPFALALALLLVFSTLLSKPSSLAELIGALLALAIVAPLSPLTIAWLTLCGYCVVTILWEPDSSLESSRQAAHT